MKAVRDYGVVSRDELRDSKASDHILWTAERDAEQGVRLAVAKGVEVFVEKFETNDEVRFKATAYVLEPQDMDDLGLVLHRCGAIIATDDNEVSEAWLRLARAVNRYELAKENQND